MVYKCYIYSLTNYVVLEAIKSFHSIDLHEMSGICYCLNNATHEAVFLLNAVHASWRERHSSWLSVNFDCQLSFMTYWLCFQASCICSHPELFIIYQFLCELCNNKGDASPPTVYCKCSTVQWAQKESAEIHNFFSAKSTLQVVHT